NIWVTNGGTGSNGSVSKLRASDGKLLGTFAVGSDPLGIAFDGANIWVATRDDSTVSKLQPAMGRLLAPLASAVCHTAWRSTGRAFGSPDRRTSWPCGPVMERFWFVLARRKPIRLASPSTAQTFGRLVSTMRRSSNS